MSGNPDLSHHAGFPGFLIPGVQKGGTSSLFFYLSQHPQIGTPDTKEVHFFDHKYDKGIDWYLGCFATESAGIVLSGEASPYYYFHPLAARRIAGHFPGIKLIVLFRDPVARAYSHYIMERMRGNEPLQTFDEALAAESARLAGSVQKIISGECRFDFNHQMYSYKARGMYYIQTLEWLSHFPREQFLFLKSERFFTDPETVLKKIYEFLAVDPILPTDLHPENVQNYDPISPATRNSLREYFADDSLKLAKLLGDEFSWTD